MEALLKNLKEHVTCSICLDTYTKPKTIACLHTFCCECLKEHALTSQIQGLYRCPECQAQVGVPEGNRFDNLPSSFHHNSLLSLLAVRRSSDGSEINCSICQKKSAEINYCFDCEKFLCPDCLKAHDLFRTAAFEGHKVTPVKNFQPEDYEALLKRQSFCSQKYHEREVTRFFCLECQSCVCQVCINTEHKSHDVVPLDKAADDEKANIAAEVERMKEMKEVCSGVIRQFETMMLELETNITTAKRQVSQAAEQMMAKIQEREREVITTLEKTRVSRTEKLNSAKELVRSLEKQLNQAAEFGNDLVQRSSSSDIMHSKKSLEQRFKQLTAEAQVPATFPVSPFVKFVSTCAPERIGLGFVTFSKTDVHGSTVEGLSQTFQAGLEAEFSFCPKTCEGEIRDSRHTDQVEVLVEPANLVASLIVNEKLDGNFQVKFVPKVPGTYNITAKINEELVANSPFTVEVTERRFDVVGEFKTGKQPCGIAVNSKGLIAVADCGTKSIQIFDKEGKYLRSVGQLENPSDVTYLNDNEILAADLLDLNHKIQQFNVQTGKFVKSFGKRGTRDGEFMNPTSVVMDSEGHVVVAEYSNSRIQVLTKDGAPVLKFGANGLGKLDHPTACVCHKNMFIVSDTRNNCLKVFDGSGQFLYKIGEEGVADGQFKLPWGLHVDKFDNVLVCDRGNERIQQFTVEGRFTGKSVVTNFRDPWGITATPDGNVLICDFEANKVYIMN